MADDDPQQKVLHLLDVLSVSIAHVSIASKANSTRSKANSTPSKASSLPLKGRSTPASSGWTSARQPRNAHQRHRDGSSRVQRASDYARSPDRLAVALQPPLSGWRRRNASKITTGPGASCAIACGYSATDVIFLLGESSPRSRHTVTK